MWVRIRSTDGQDYINLGQCERVITAPDDTAFKLQAVLANGAGVRDLTGSFASDTDAGLAAQRLLQGLDASDFA